MSSCGCDPVAISEIARRLGRSRPTVADWHYKRDQHPRPLPKPMWTDPARWCWTHQIKPWAQTNLQPWAQTAHAPAEENGK